MSIQDLPPDSDETATEPEDVTVRRLVRAIDFAEGFWLGFAKSNTPAQRRRLSALCRDLLEPLKIRVLEIELNEPVTDLLPVLRERLAHEAAREENTSTDETSATPPQPKLAVFVHGLERSVPSREAYPPLLSSLNLKRELFRQEIPHPLLLWLPDYALTALARKSPDFWAWRSGLYEFAPEREAAEQSLKTVSEQSVSVMESLSEQSKRERLVTLKGLLEDYRELGDGAHELEARANILLQIGLVNHILGELTEAKQAYQESLTISRNLGDKTGEAAGIHNLAYVAQHQGELQEARALYEESLEIEKRLGNQEGVAATLHHLGILAQTQGELEEAQRLYEESLEISKKLGDRSGMASTTSQLGIVYYLLGQFEESKSTHEESLAIRRELREQQGIAIDLNQLAMLASGRGDFDEARQLYGESLEIKKRLGDQRGTAVTSYNLGKLAADEGNREKARCFFREALSIWEKLGSPSAEAARRYLEIMEDNGEIPS